MKRKEVKRRDGQLLSYVILLVCVVALMISIRTCSTPPAGAQKERKASGGDTIDVAISYSPMTLYRYADTLGGFSRDMLEQMASREGLILKYHPVTSVEQSLKGLDEGLYDLVVSDIARTADIGDKYAFTSDIYLARQILVQPSDSTRQQYVRNQLDFARKHVLVEAASPAYWRLHNLIAEIGDTIYIDADSRLTSEQLFLKVAAGEAPLAVINEQVASIMSKDYPDVDISTAVSFTQFQAWLLRTRDKELLEKLNAAISRFKTSPDYSALAERYGFNPEKTD